MDTAIVPGKTVELVAALKHARGVGISDHFKYLHGGILKLYAKEISDAHQPPIWLGQSVAQYAAAFLGIEEHLLLLDAP